MNNNPLYDLRDELKNSGSTNDSSNDSVTMKDVDRNRMRRNAYIKMVAMVGFVVAAMIFGSIAWFTSNKENNASGMGVKVASSLFEIKTTGTKSDYAELINSSPLDYLSGDGVGANSFQTGGNTFWLELRLDDDELNKGLQPGSSGTVSFTIVPNSAYDDDTENHLHITYSYSLKAYALTAEKRQAIMALEEIIASNGEPTQAQITAAQVSYSDLILLDTLTSDNGGSRDTMLAARELLNGHLLFFENYVNDHFTGWNTDHTGSQDVAFGDEQTVTIHWVWPRTFSQIVGESSIFDSNAKSAIINYMIANESAFFSDLNKAEILGSNEANLTTTAITNVDNVIPFSTGYNNADQMIGENIQYILVEFTIDGAILPNE